MTTFSMPWRIFGFLLIVFPSAQKTETEFSFNITRTGLSALALLHCTLYWLSSSHDDY